MRLSFRILSRWGYLMILLPILSLNALGLIYWPEPWIFLLPSVSGVIAMVIAYFLEQKMPFRLDWRRPITTAGSDLFQTVILLPTLIFTSCILWRFLVKTFSWSLPWWSGDRPWWLHFFSALLLGEFLFYWIHRLSHRSPLLWKLHRIHHDPVQLDWYNAGKFNGIDLFLNFFLYLAPFYLFPVPKTALVMALTLNVVTGILEHANINFKSGIVNWLFNTGELHRWHHSVILSESKRNYGKVLSVWNITFRTYLKRDLRELVKIGVE